MTSKGQPLPSHSVLLKIISEQWHVLSISGLVCALVWRHLAKYFEKLKVQRKVRERGDRSRKSLESLRQLMKKERVDTSITDLSFFELQQALQSGNLKAVDVLNAYLAKAVDVHEKTNALTDYITTARAEAEALDRKPASERGLLHGIPISVKESCGLKGTDCTTGVAKTIDVHLRTDSIMIQIYKSLGAVPFVRTNVSHALRDFGCENPIFGTTTHPMNSERSPGGSTGGEGALIAAGGSILGIGNDIGGSLRIPAAYCGIWSLKPTSDRLSNLGNFGRGLRIGGQKTINLAEGPLARDVYTLVQYMRAVLCPRLYELDSLLPPLPFREEIYESKRPLRIGYYTYDGCTRCVPAVVRAVNLAKDALESLGHTVLEFKHPDGLWVMKEIVCPGLFADDCHSYNDLVKHDEAPYDFVQKMVESQQRPYFMRWLLAKWKSIVQKDPPGAGAIGRKPIRSTHEFWNQNLDTKIFKREFFRRLQDQNLDLIICPSMPSVAVKLGLYRKMWGTISYSILYNILDCPVGTVPVSHVTEEDVRKTLDPAYYPAETYIEKLLREDSVNSEGLPVGVQVVGLPYQEELVLRLLSEIEPVLGYTDPHSRTNTPII